LTSASASRVSHLKGALLRFFLAHL
jgi:hypothetical protein